MNSIENQLSSIIKVAKKAAFCSDFGRSKHGCVIFYKKKDICSIGWNSYKTSSLQTTYDKYRGKPNIIHCRHAEIDAIQNFFIHSNKAHLKYSPNKLSIFIYREHKNGTYAMSAPCPACRKAIEEMGIKNIYYTGENSIIFEEINQ